MKILLVITFWWAQVRYLLWIVIIFCNLLLGYINLLTHLCVCLCSDKIESRDSENEHTDKSFYWNHADTFLDLTKKLRGNLVEIQKPQPCQASKEDLQWRGNAFFGKIKNIKYFIKITLAAGVRRRHRNQVRHDPAVLDLHWIP